MTVAALAIDLCRACHRWHEQPRPCAHQMDRPCIRCSKPVGPRYTGDYGEAAGDGGTCWRCHWWGA